MAAELGLKADWLAAIGTGVRQRQPAIFTKLCVWRVFVSAVRTSHDLTLRILAARSDARRGTCASDENQYLLAADLMTGWMI